MDKYLWLEVVRPLLASLLIPPAPLIFLLAAGALLLRTKPLLGSCIAATSAALLWLCSTVGLAQLLVPALLDPPPFLGEARIEQLRADTPLKPRTAIIVLGSGIFQSAPEYKAANLTDHSLERLRYGIWLSRKTGIPVGFSGGVGWAGELGASEAETAQLIATTEFQHPLRWVEHRSRDTLENARFSVAMLREDGIQHILVVSSSLQAKRAFRAFSIAAAGEGMTIESAPMNIAVRLDHSIYNWIPTPYGSGLVPTILREWVAYLAGA